MPQKKVAKVAQQLADLRQMMTAKTPEEILVAYASLLGVSARAASLPCPAYGLLTCVSVSSPQSQPGVTPPIVEKLLGTRPDLTKKDLQAIVKRVQDAFKEKIVDTKIAAVHAHAAAMAAAAAAAAAGPMAAGSTPSEAGDGGSAPPAAEKPPELPASLQELAKDPEKALKALANMAKQKVFQPLVDGTLVNPKQMFINFGANLRNLGKKGK